MRGGGGWGDCRVYANEYSCAHHVTWSPNKLWNSTSVLNLRVCVVSSAGSQNGVANRLMRVSFQNDQNVFVVTWLKLKGEERFGRW
jgi:hypothetical protein